MDITDLDISEFKEKEETLALQKEAIAKSDAFMATVGQEPLEVYRMEKFVPTLQPFDSYGKFYTGDSYVCVKKNDDCYDLHYWHGKECTADEMGSSACWTVQLSGVLKMDSNHHLEEQMQESDHFMSYFKKTGVEYMPGGIESGFREPTKQFFEPRLLQVKGARYPRVFSVPMEAASINEGDAFILDLNERIFFWPGKDCNVNEKMKGLEVTTNIRKTERHCHADIFFPRENDTIDAEFWSHLGGKPATINPATDDTAAAEDDADMKYALFKISNDTGKITCTEITERPLQRTHLATDDCFVLELNKQVVCWIGKKADPEEKKNALIVGKSFVKAHNKPEGTRVSRVCENCEDTHFKSFFNGFYPIAVVDHGGQFMDSTTSANQDMEKLANEKRKNVDALMTKLGEGTPKVDVYLCKDDKNIKLDEHEYGHFFQGNVYLIDILGTKHRYLIQWFGPRLPSDEVSRLRLHMDLLTGGEFRPNEWTRVSVKQGHEDDTLLTFFKDGFICHDGEYQCLLDRENQIKEKGCLYKIQGPFGEKPQAIQQDNIKAENLNSNDAFFVVEAGGAHAWAWLGEGADESETAYASSLGAKLQPNAAFAVIKEHEETDEFWAALGGKAEYPNTKSMGFAPGFQPLLFEVSNASGYSFMKPVTDFLQEDLSNNDVMVLDCFRKVYVWEGLKANEIEKKAALKKVDAFIDGATDGRDPKDVEVIIIEPCGEPMAFKTNFPEWEDEVSQQWLELDPYEKHMKEIEDEKAAYALKFKKDEKVYEQPSGTYSLTELQKGTPEGVNPAAKQNYLSEDDFQAAFGMDKAKFDTLKEWKQKDLKKKCNLF